MENIPGTDEVILVTASRYDHRRVTYRFRYVAESTSAENRWVPLAIDTPQYLVHDVALQYDPMDHVAILLWPPRFEQELRPHLLRLDVAQLRQRSSDAE